VCYKKRLSEQAEPKVQSLSVCKMLCDPFAALWPRPSGAITFAKTLAYLDPLEVTLTAHADKGAALPAKMSELVANLQKYTKALVLSKSK
jgi:hypothetical protein